jgi:hypothetical protein
MAAAPALALDGPGRALVASNRIQKAANTPIVGDPGTTIGTAFIPPYSGTVRLTWEIRSHDATQVDAVVFVEHLDSCAPTPTTSTTFVTQTCDLRVAAGMPINLSAAPSNGTNFVTLRRVQLRYRVVNSDGEAIVWETAGAV